jgi:hypothetical protein
MGHEDMAWIHMVQERVKRSKLAQAENAFDVFGKWPVAISKGHQPYWIELFLGFTQSL